MEDENSEIITNIIIGYGAPYGRGNVIKIINKYLKLYHEQHNARK